MSRERVLDPAAVEQVDELRPQLRELAIVQSLHRAQPGHRRAARHELELHAAVRRQARRGATQHVGVLDLERRERRIVGARSLHCRVDGGKLRVVRVEWP